MKVQALLALTTLAFAPQGGNLNVGDRVPEKKFQDVMYNFDGAESLEDYLGEPVMVDWWGIN